MKKMIGFTEEQIKRYSRHIILQEIGEEGQKKICNSKVLVVGAGGLGSPAIIYLAAAGVGRIGIVDMDVVDLSNLQRQILHTVNDINKPKTSSAKEKVNALNPDVEVVEYNERITSENVMDIIKDYDVVIDASDNFPTRYLLNDACFFENKVLIHGAIFEFEGEVTTIIPKDSPCYRCIYPEPPPTGMMPSAREVGVLGVLPGVIGIIQATEAIKYILNIGDLLKGRMLIYDALSMKFREVKLRKDPNCCLCGKNPTIKELIDYEKFCGLRR